MLISRVTTYSLDSGVAVHSRNDRAILLSKNTVSQSDLTSQNISSRLKLDVFDGGTLSGIKVDDSIITVYNGGTMSSGNITNHTVQNVLYGGSTISVRYGSGNGSGTIVHTSTPTVSSSLDTHCRFIGLSTIANGPVKSTFMSTTELTFVNLHGDGTNNGSAIVEYGGVVKNPTLDNGGKIAVFQGGKASGVSYIGAGVVDVNAGGELVNFLPDSNYTSIGQFESCSLVKKITTEVSSAFELPTRSQWYLADDSGMTNPLNISAAWSNITASGEVTKSALFVISSGLDVAYLGSYSLMLDHITDDTYAASKAMSGVWIKTSISSVQNYIAIERSRHEDGNLYWELNSVVSTYSGITPVVEKTLVAFAPSYDVYTSAYPITGMVTRRGPDIVLHASAITAGSVVAESGTVITVEDYAVLGSCIVSSGAELNIERYALVGLDNISAVSVKDGAVMNVVVPGTSSYVFMSDGRIVDQSAALSSNIVPSVDFVMSSGNFSNMPFHIRGNSAVGCDVYNTKINTESGAYLSNINIWNSGRLIINSGAVADDIIVFNGGTVHVRNGASANVITASEARVIFDSEATGSINLQDNSLTLSWGIPTYWSNVIKSSSGGATVSLGYNISDVVNYDWDAGVENVVSLTSGTSGLSYTIMLGESTYSGSMARVPLNNSNIVYSDVVSNISTMAFTLVNGSESLELYATLSGTTASVGQAVLSEHNIVATSVGVLSNIASSGADYIQIADRTRVDSANMEVFESATISVTGDAVISKIHAVKEDPENKFNLILRGYDSDYKHVAEVKDLEVNGEVNLLVGKLARVKTTGDDTILSISGNFSATMEANILNTNSNMYQRYNTVYSGTIPTGGYMVGFSVDGNLNVGADVRAVGLRLNDHVTVENTAYADGAIITSTAVGDSNTVIATVAPGGLFLHPHADSVRVVECADGATIDPIDHDVMMITSKTLSGSTVIASGIVGYVSRYYCARAYMTSAILNFYTKHRVACPNLTNEAYSPEQPIWFGQNMVDAIEVNDNYTCSGVYSKTISEHNSYPVYKQGTNLAAFYYMNGGTSCWAFHSAVTNISAPISELGYLDYTVSYVNNPDSAKWQNGTVLSYYTSGDESGYRVLGNLSAAGMYKQLDPTEAYAPTYCPATSGDFNGHPVYRNAARGKYLFTYSNGSDLCWCIDSVVRKTDVPIESVGFKDYATTSNTDLTACTFVSGATVSSTTIQMDMVLRYIPNYYRLVQGSVTEHEGYKTFSSGTELCWNSDGYNTDLEAKYRNPTIKFRTSTTSDPAIAVYTNAYEVIPYVDPSSQARTVFNITESTIISGLLTGPCTNISVNVQCAARDRYGNLSKVNKYHTWDHDGALAGYVVPEKAMVAVKSAYLVSPRILSGGRLFLFSSAYVSNATLDRGAILNYTFNRGQFRIDGDVYIDEVNSNIGIDSLVTVTGSALVGDDNRYVLSAVDETQVDDERVWVGKFDSNQNDVTVHRTITLCTDESGTHPWKMIDTYSSSYLDPIYTLDNLISSATPMSDYINVIDKMNWKNGIVHASSAVLKVGGTSIGTLMPVSSTATGYAIDNTRVSVVTPDVDTSKIDAFPESTMLVTEGGNYIVARTANNITIQYYDSEAGVYNVHDVLDEITVGSAVSSTVVLESVSHAMDPWLIYSRDNKSASIYRTNTKRFAIEDKGARYGIHRSVSGLVLNGGTTNMTDFVVYSDVVAYNRAIVNMSNFAMVKDCVFSGISAFNANVMPIVDGAVVIGASTLVTMNTSSPYAYLKNIVLSGSTYLTVNVGATSGILDPYSSTTTVFNGSRYVSETYHYAPVVLSGDSTVLPRLNTGSGNSTCLCEMMDEYDVIGPSGFVDYPCAFSRHSITHAVPSNDVEHHRRYVENGAMTAPENTSLGTTSAYYPGNNNTVYREQWHNMEVISNGSLNILRNAEMLNLTFDSATYTNGILDNYTVVYSDTVRLPRVKWVSPRLTMLRSNTCNYANTANLFHDFDFVSSADSGMGTISVMHEPVITSFGTAVAGTVISSGVPNYYIYSDNIGTSGDNINLSSTMVQVMPGATVGRSTNIKMGMYGGLFVERHGMVYDVDVTSVHTSKNMSTISSRFLNANIHLTHLQHITVGDLGVVVVKPTTGMILNNTYTNQEENAPARLTTITNVGTAKGRGRILRGVTKGVPAGSRVMYSANNNSTGWTAAYHNAAIAVAPFGMMTINNKTWVCTNSGNWSGTRAAITASSSAGVYIGSSAILNLGSMIIQNRGTVIIESGATLGDILQICVNPGAELVLMDGNLIDFNSRYHTWVEHKSGWVFSSGVNYYTRTGTNQVKGSSTDGYTYTLATVTPGTTATSQYWTSSNGALWCTASNADIVIRSNFVMSNLPRLDKVEYEYISSNIAGSIYYPIYNTPVNTLSFGYDIAHGPSIGAAATNLLTEVDGVYYRVFNFNTARQSFTMQFEKSISDVNTGSVVSGWTLRGNVEYAPGVVESGIVYYCSGRNPAGLWSNMLGRYIPPLVSCGNQNTNIMHNDTNTWWDCANTDVTNIDFGTGYTIKDYVNVVHVNGYATGAIPDSTIFGEAAYLTSTATLTSSACLIWQDADFSVPHVPVSLDGTILFKQVTLDYRRSASDVISIENNNSKHWFRMIHSATGGQPEISYKFDVYSSALNTATVVRKYNIVVNKTELEGRQVVWPFITRECVFVGGDFQGASTEDMSLICTWPLYRNTVSDASIISLKGNDKLVVESNGIVQGYGKCRTVKVNQGGQLLVTNYARNVVVSSGGTLTIRPVTRCNVMAFNTLFEGAMRKGKTYEFSVGYYGEYETYETLGESGVILQIYNTNNNWYIKDADGVYGSSVQLTGSAAKPWSNYLSSSFNVELLKGTDIAKVDNLLVKSGGTVNISGYVTGFEAEEGAIINPSPVDYRYVRTSSFYPKEYDWN